MDLKFYPLHAHTSVGSIGDSVLGIKDYVQRAKDYGLDALAVTDHGSMSGMLSFVRECRENDIKPIIGMEAYVVPNNDIVYQKENKCKKGAAHHLVLLAKNNEGLKNLLRIHNQAATDGYYYEARTDWDHLLQWGSGIIALSACVGGEIPQAILAGDMERASDIALFYRECFDEFYLELQPGAFIEQAYVNDALVQMAEKLDIPLVVTNDIHYLNYEDAERHNYHVKLARKMQDVDGSFVYPDDCYWFMDAKRLMATFYYGDTVTEEVVRDAIKMTGEIAAKCTLDFESKVFMPAFPVKDGETEEEHLSRLCYDRLSLLVEGKPNPQEYADRLAYELDVIAKKGFCGYFLIVADYVEWAKKNGIPVGPGRGSAAGSLVTFLLGICQVDPIKYGLLFERFLDPHREAIPDIDIDFSPGEGGRDRMFRYAVERYGYDHCALVSTIGMRKAKGAVHDAARILGYKPQLGNEIAKLIPTVYYGDDGEKTVDMSIPESIEAVPALKKYQKSHSDILSLASRLEGLPSSCGIHAAGILISPVSLLDRVPLIRPNKEGVLATSLTLSDAETSYVKFDFLSIGSLDVLKQTEDDAGWHFDYQDDRLYEDEAVWDVIGSSHTVGLFQISSKTYRDRMPRLKPRSIKELAACLALVRAPSISAKTDEVYMRIVEGRKEVEKIHPLYDAIMAETNGIMIYQEQIMKLVVAFGMDLTTGYRIVKLSAKKKLEKLEEYRQKFLLLAKEKNCSEETAHRIFDMIVKSGEYSFNAAHAVSYALLTYASAYLKVHYPLQFMRNLLTYTYEKSKDDEYMTVLKDCIRQGIDFLPADVNYSDWAFTTEDGKLRVGLCAVKGLGEKAAALISSLRKEKGSFHDLSTFIYAVEEEKCGRIFNKKVFTAMIFSGLFDTVSAETTRKQLFEEYLEARGKKEEVPEKISLGTKNFDIFPHIDSNRKLERIFCGVNFAAG